MENFSSKHMLLAWDHIKPCEAENPHLDDVDRLEEEKYKPPRKGHHSKKHFEIHLKYLPLSNGCIHNHSMDCRHLCYRGKGLLIVQIILLGKPFCYKPGLIPHNKPIIFCFHLIHPTKTNHMFPKRKRNQITCMSLIKGYEFLNHSILPKRI